MSIYLIGDGNSKALMKNCTLNNSALTATDKDGEYVPYSDDIMATGFDAVYIAVITYDNDNK